MRDRFGEPELLAFIEDEMSPKKRLALAARLEHDPDLRDRVARMRHDRDELRALPAPELPVDFLAALEPELARPMLMSPAPGAYRRRHRRSSDRRLVRFSIAAIFGAAILAGVWGATVLVPRMLRSVAQPAQVASDSVPDPTNGEARPGAGIDPASEVDDMAWPPRDATVHHRAPLPARPNESAPKTSEPATLASAPVIPEAPLALVLPVSDVAAGEELVRRVAAELALPPGADPRRTKELRGAVVRNFSMEEAQRLVQRLDAERPRTGGAPPDAFAGLNGNDRTGRPARDRVLASLRRLGKHRVEADPGASGRLFGPDELMPDYERQLELSALGATHTVTLPIDMLSEFLGRLRVAEGQPTHLRPLTGDPTDVARTELQRWVENHALVRDFATQLGAAPDRTYVMLPVVIRLSAP